MFAPIVWFCLWNGLTLRESWLACQALKESFFGHPRRFRSQERPFDSRLRNSFRIRLNQVFPMLVEWS
jgi:hypothetical protein